MIQSSLKGPEGHCESYEHWNCFKGDVGETSVRQDGVHIDFSACSDTILD